MAISASTTDELLVSQEGHVLVLTLNRPEVLNAINGPMLAELTAKLKEANRDPEVRCVILTGNGRGFCSGLDLKQQQSRVEGTGGASSGNNESPRYMLFDLENNPINTLWSMDKPVIAAVNGAAAGYGMDMTLLCDIRIMADNAKLAAVVVKRNVVPESGGTWLLPRLVGWGKAAEIFYRGRTLGAEECEKLSLCNAVVPAADLMKTAMEWAQDIAGNAPAAVQTTKRMMRLGQNETFEATVDHLMVHLKGLFAMDDFKEAIRAFNERRPAKFTGR